MSNASFAPIYCNHFKPNAVIALICPTSARSVFNLLPIVLLHCLSPPITVTFISSPDSLQSPHAAVVTYVPFTHIPSREEHGTILLTTRGAITSAIYQMLAGACVDITYLRTTDGLKNHSPRSGSHLLIQTLYHYIDSKTREK